MSEAVTIRLPDGREVVLEDWTDKPLYSTLDVLAGATSQEMLLFQYTGGDSVPAYAPVPVTAPLTATDKDTNMATAGGLASSEEFMVYSIRPEVFQLSVEDETHPDFSVPAAPTNGEPTPTPTFLSIMHMQLLLVLTISEKEYAQAGLGYFNFGGGVYGFAGNTSVRATGQKGEPGNEAVRTYAIPQHIGGQEKFKVALQNPPGDALLINLGDGSTEYGDDAKRFARVRVYLDGLRKRPTA